MWSVKKNRLKCILGYFTENEIGVPTFFNVFIDCKIRKYVEFSEFQKLR